MLELGTNLLADLAGIGYITLTCELTWLIYVTTCELTWLVDLVLEFGDNLRHEGGLGIGEEGNRGHQSPAVVVDHILTQ